MVDESGAAPHLPWSDSFNVGVDVLDTDHRALVAQINTVCAAWHIGLRAEALQALASLCTLAGAHFGREEAVLRDLTGYLALEAHTGEHRSRMTQLTALRQRFHEAADGDMQLCTDLIDWFVRQSIGHDAAIKAYFDDRGPRFAAHARPRKAS